jgi:hypothetical protein
VAGTPLFLGKKVYCDHSQPAVTCPSNTSCIGFTCNTVSGACDPTSVVCSSPDPCVLSTCDPLKGCLYQSNVCESFTACVPRVCLNASTCVDGTPLNCDDGKICTDDTCDAKKGCVHTPIICQLTAPCTRVDGCYEPGNQFGYPPGCRIVNETSLFDLCRVCYGDNTACFFSSVVSAGAVGGIAGGVVAGIVVACVIAALLAAFFARKGYDYYQSRSALGDAGAMSNPMFVSNAHAAETGF